MNGEPNELPLVLLIDAQPAFFAGMHGDPEPVLARIERLLRLAELCDLPLIATLERPTEEKGDLHERLAVAFPSGSELIEKSTFDLFAEAPIRAAVEAAGRERIVVAGAETDVCVLFSVLSLLKAGYGVTLLEDCLFTSEPHPHAALHRMLAAGAVPCTYKTLAYELTATVDRSQWPDRWRSRLAEKGDLFPPPEDLPPRPRCEL